MRLLSLILLICLLSFIQSLGFSISGVKPDLALVGVIAVSFFVSNLWEGFLLVALAALILKFSPGFESEILTLSLIGAGALMIKKYLPWHYFFSNLILITVGTFIFYLFLAANLIPTIIFFKELILNLIAGTLIFALLSFLWQNK